MDLTVFVMIRTRNHDSQWMKRFRQRAESIPEIVEMHRVGGDWDYLLKVVTTGMSGYDRVYQALIAEAPSRWVCIDAVSDRDTIQAQIREHVAARLS